jgi:protein phosphatase
MAIATLKLHCPSPRCEAENPATQLFCQRCGTGLTRRYLWVAGAQPLRPGDLLGDRYWVIDRQVVLDTKPGIAPLAPEIPTDSMVPYLRMFPCRLSVPQVYGLLFPADSRSDRPAFLLEDAPLYPHRSGLESGPADTTGAWPTPGSLMPDIETAWTQATEQRRLGWLWQMARLWPLLLKEGVATTLLNPSQIRVDGSTIRLLELDRRDRPPSLAELGYLWAHWSESIGGGSPFVEDLCRAMQQQRIVEGGTLIEILDRALQIATPDHAGELEIATYSDAGPTRSHNEDSCLPLSGTFRLTRSGPQSLTVVCDGLGGHEGGDIASQLAADVLQQVVQTPPTKRQQADWAKQMGSGPLGSGQSGANPFGAGPLGANELAGRSPVALLNDAINQANDEISQRNDNERRQKRQRMGTTIVSALALDHLLYLAYVGDSRIYLVTARGCRQVTIDDDVASQQTRIGQMLYRQALGTRNAGALTQALGMNDSNNLQPTIQRLFLDEEVVILLCSDGLSDFDRIDEVWDSILTPVIIGNRSIAAAANDLIAIANQRNGHDNVTIALMHYQVQAHQPLNSSTLRALFDDLPPAPVFVPKPEAAPIAEVRAAAPVMATIAPTELIVVDEGQPIEPSGFKKRLRWLFPTLMGVLMLGGVGAAGHYLPGSPSNNAPPTARP